MTLRPVLLALLLAGCATVPTAAPGPTYRALGTEPFWSLVLDGRTMTFTEANAPGSSITEPQPRGGDVLAGSRIRLEIVRGQRCSDGMSDRTHPDTVRVQVDGRTFAGCGGEPVMPASLEGTSWSVERLNGRAIAGGERYYVRFEDGRLSARFGCNSLSAPVRQEGVRLLPGALAATRMACPDMRDETEASAVLQLPADLAWDAGERLTISNSAGTIVLRRVFKGKRPRRLTLDLPPCHWTRRLR